MMRRNEELRLTQEQMQKQVLHGELRHFTSADMQRIAIQEIERMRLGDFQPDFDLQDISPKAV